MMDSSVVWNNQDPTLSGPSHDDFQQFLDMGINNLDDGLQFDFPDFNPQQNGGDMDTRMDSGRGTPGQDTTMQEHIPGMTTTSRHTSLHGTPIVHSHPSSESLVELDAQIQYLQQQRHQQQQRQMQEQQRNYYAQRRIPPTPNSIEMHGSSSQFYPSSDSQEQAMYERFRLQAREQDVSL
jgi:hypothetical protein